MSPAARIMLRWRTPDPAAATRRLAAIGFDVANLQFDVADLAVVRSPTGDRLEVAEAPAPTGVAAVPEHPNGLGRLLAIGWATVDLERAAQEFGQSVVDLLPDRLLGARAALLGDGPILLLEPNTEARLAATLARWGEGPAALYLSAPDGRLPHGASPVSAGPFGRSALLEPGAVHGPHLIACSGAGAGRRDPSVTIRR